MSSSRGTDLLTSGGKKVVTDKARGTIFSPSGELELRSITREEGLVLSGAELDEYMERVKAKAIDMATTIVKEAREEADMLRSEAEELNRDAKLKAEEFFNKVEAEAHEKGYGEGYEKGQAEAMAEAKDELDALRSGMADSASAILSAIEGQCSHIFDRWREDIVSVCRLAVEKVAAKEISEERETVLKNLIYESVAILEKNRRLIIKTNPEDEMLIGEIIDSVKAKYPDISSWEVRADEEITPGGLIVESEFSLAESLVESRLAAVDKVLAHLSLPKAP